MSNKSIIIVISVCIGLFFTAFLFAENQLIGTKAPAFNVKSGDDIALTLDAMKGKAVVIFYETKEIVEKNRKFKNELNRFYNEQPETVKKLIVKLPIINCSSAFFPVTGIWKSKLRENSIKEGIMIFGDWDGRMFSDYKMKDKESNVIIIDKKGFVRYFASGKIEDTEINKIRELLNIIGNEK